VAASAAVYGARAPLYGGLDPTPPERITAAEDGHVVDLGGGRRLVMLETPGHARHHMAVLDEETGTVLAGDALGARFPGSGLYPALPPPDVDPVAGDRSLARLAGIAPERLQLAHFGSAGDPEEALDLARRQLALMARAAQAGPDRERIAAAVEALLPLGPAVGDADALRRWTRLGWAEANIDGLAVWAQAELL
jgi:glyoxylase-like metal-dependent hydrolase (beta-lactamase superfamily II)